MVSEAADEQGSALPHTIPQPTTDLPLLARRADYALRVVSVRCDGHLLTRFYATLAGAEGAVRRAHGRGCAAALQLVRIVPTSIALADLEHLLAEVGGEGK